MNPTDPNVASGNPDGDAHTTWQEWIADTNPTNALSYFRLMSVPGSPSSVAFTSSSNRLYSLLASTNLTGSNSFVAVAGQTNITGNGAIRTLTDTNPASAKFYQVQVELP